MEQQKVKTIFFGSGNFAVKILEGIIKMPFLDVVAVVTQPDKPAGRKKLLTPCPVMQKLTDLKWEKPVYKPEKLRAEAEKIIAEIKPEFILVADYGQIIPASVINYPKYKCLNVHGSLLPDLRGAVPAAVAILKGYQVTGVSIPVMTPALDDGAVVAAAETYILPEDTTYTLRMRLAEIANELLKKILPDWFSGRITPVPQQHSKASITQQADIAKEKAQITKDTTVEMAERMVRAFNPWPVAWVEAEVNGQQKRIKLIKVSVRPDLEFPAGQFIKHEKQLFLGLKDGTLQLLELQLEGKNAGSSKDYLFLDKTVLSH